MLPFTVPDCVQYGMVRYRVGVYGIFQVLRKKNLNYHLARWEKDELIPISSGTGKGDVGDVMNLVEGPLNHPRGGPFRPPSTLKLPYHEKSPH